MPETLQAQVFLSYSVRDRQTAAKFARAFEELGTPVWWDLESIPVGADWSEFLLDLVSPSVCTIVLWSLQSVESKWVLREAEVAFRRRVMVPVLIDDVLLPAQFRGIQTILLRDWNGNPKERGFQRLFESVRRFIDTAPTPAQETRVIKESQRLAERRAEELFQQNLRSESIIEHVALEKTALYDQLSWSLKSGVNILLGRNGYGKTHLLRSILALLQYDDEAALQTMGKGSGSVSLVRNGGTS